jgi:molybdopterin molybdotransferase
VIDVEKALALLEQESEALEVIEVPLDRARGHVLAETVVADRDFPPTDRSAMDGYAVRASDVTEAGQQLELIGEIRAGQPVGSVVVGPGQAVRIMTGSIVPPGVDAVVMVEYTAETDDGSRVRIDDIPKRGRHIRRRGEDLQCGGMTLEPGTPIDAPEIAALASVGKVSVRVHRKPVVCVLSTGDEIVGPQQTPAEHQIRNSNAYALVAQLAELGLAGSYLGIAGDELDDLDRRIAEGLEADALLITGGVSAGKYDLVSDALSAAGMRVLFHEVAVKPGKPILAGRHNGCLVFGLPGNPVSTYTGFAVFVLPTLRRMLGYRQWRNRPLLAKLAEPLTLRTGRETYLLARLDPAEDGLTASRVQHTGSGDILALARSNGFIVCPPEGAELPAGAPVRVLPWINYPHR